MRKLKLAILVFAASTLSVSAAAAQACLGLPSFSARPAHINLGLEFPESASSYAIGVGAGRHNSLFANLGGGFVSYDDDRDLEGKAPTSSLGFLEFGYQVAVSKLQLCPVGGGYFAVGPDDELAGIKVTTRGATAGLSVGMPIKFAMITLVPNTAVRYDYASQKVEEQDIGSANTTYNSSFLDLGLGLIFRDRFGIQPLVHVPISGDDAKTSFGLYASVAFGWPIR